MLNVWKKFLTLEAAFPTSFNKKGAIPELSAQGECGIPEAAGNQTEIWGEAGGEKGMADFIITNNNEPFSQKKKKKNLIAEKTCYKAGWRNGFGCGSFSGGFRCWLGFREVPHP